jgi:regulator of sigma E protease
LISVLSFALAISLLVAVHEFGHFWVARKVGIKVLRFSIGFGKPLWSRKIGADQTEFALSAIPLGGYVKMLDEREGDIPDSERHRSFQQAPMWGRMAVLVAGPLANFLFAILAYWFMFVAGVPGLKPVLGEVDAGSLAAEAGLRAGDTILSVRDQRVDTWEGTLLILLDDLLDDGRISLEVERQDGTSDQLVIDATGEESRLTEPGELFPGLGISPWRPAWPPRVQQVDAGGPADRAGMQAGDLIVAIDGEQISDWRELVQELQSRANQQLALVIERDGQRQTLLVDVEEMDRDGAKVGRIGIQGAQPDPVPDQMYAQTQYGPIAAVSVALSKTWDMSALTLRMLWKMIQGVVSPKNISGPINIAQYAGVSASIGVTAFVSFLAVISISLGIINLMPVPMLDGGQLLYHFAELVTGRPLPEKVQMVGHQIGLLLLVLLMTFAFYNDIARLLD